MATSAPAMSVAFASVIAAAGIAYLLGLKGFIGSSLDQAAAHAYAANCRGVRDDVLPRKMHIVVLADDELRAGAERRRDHALTTLRRRRTKYVGDCGSDRRMTFSRRTGFRQGR